MRPVWIAATWVSFVALGVGAEAVSHRQPAPAPCPTSEACPFVSDHRLADYQDRDRLMRRSQCWEPM